ncbi:MAG: tetratricopeptide repeat protein, partial [Gemmatimonadaceae bacterium]
MPPPPRLLRTARAAATLGLTLLASGCLASGPVGAGGIARLQRARAARPNDAKVVRALGLAFYENQRYDSARVYLSQATRLNPRDGTAALYLGLTSERLNDFAAAKAAYRTYQQYGRTSRVRRQLEARLAALTRLELQVAAKSAVAQEQQLSAQQGSPRTVAVMPLRFIGRDSTLRPLERGLAELITIDLARSSQLTVVERARIQALLDELALQSSGATDSATNVRAGKMIQAGRIVSGQILQDEQRLRVDAAIVNTTTSGVAGGAASENTIEQLFAIQKAIVLQLFDSLGVRLTTAERNAIEQRPTRSMQAFLAYSRGLEFQDQGRYLDAARFFGEAARIDPGFSMAAQKSAESQAAAQGAQLTAATLDANLAGTPEEAAAEQSAQGSIPGAGIAENSARNVADGLNPSQAGNATGAAGVGTV